MSQIAKLVSIGFLVVGTNYRAYAATQEQVPAATQEVLARERATAPERQISESNLRVREIFVKDWCGPIDLSSEGVAALEDWDTAFVRQEVGAAVRKFLS